MNQTVLKKKKTFIGMVKWCSPYVTKHNIRQCDFVCKKKIIISLVYGKIPASWTLLRVDRC